MKPWIWTVSLALVFAGCTATPAAAPTPVGNPAVYERISNTTDCAELQAEFDTAENAHQRAEAGSSAAEIALSYMKAADTQMEKAGCYQ